MAGGEKKRVSEIERERLRRMEERMHGPVDREAAVGPPVGKVEYWRYGVYFEGDYGEDFSY